MKKYIVIAFAALAAAACTNLDEHLYSQISKDEFMKHDEVIAQYTSRPYTKLQNWGEEQSYWTLVLQIGNEMAVPKSWDKSWGEERYVELQTPNITTSNKLVGCGWDFCFNGMSACIVAIYELGVTNIMVVAHSHCGACHMSYDHFHEQMLARGVTDQTLDTIRKCGIDLGHWLEGFMDTHESVRRTVETIRTHPLVPTDIIVRGFIIDSETGLLEEVAD